MKTEYTPTELQEMAEKNGGSLYLRGTAITSLPDNLTVGGAIKISQGSYEYKGYIINNCGYFEPEHRICWEAINKKTGCADYHEYTKRDIMRGIDLDNRK